MDSGVLEFSITGDDPVIIYQGKTYKILLDLIKVCPELIQNESDLSSFAKALNHLLFGKQFDVIVDVENYAQKYLARKTKEVQSPSKNSEIAMLWKGDYNIDIILPPMKMDTFLFCFLENRENGLPFLLTTPFPITAPRFEFNLQPVPFVDEFE